MAIALGHAGCLDSQVATALRAASGDLIEQQPGSSMLRSTQLFTHPLDPNGLIWKPGDQEIEGDTW
eukprot:1298537-Prymnesium_polylepis.1